MCRCGQQATSELSYAEEMDQRNDASSPTPPSSLPTDGSYQTPVMESTTCLILVPEEVQLPSPTSSEEEVIPVPPLRAMTPGREVSGQRCWTRHKFDKTPGAGASSRFFWRSSGLRGQGRARPYPAGRGEARGSSGDWRLRAEQHPGPSEPPATSHWPEHGLIRGSPSQAVQYGWKSLSPGGSSMDGDPEASEPFPSRGVASARGGRRGRCWGDILSNCSYSCAGGGGCDGGRVRVFGRAPLTLLRVRSCCTIIIGRK